MNRSALQNNMNQLKLAGCADELSSNFAINKRIYRQIEK
jgi:hypothetical protein